MTKTKELLAVLAVLDLPEDSDEQRAWIGCYLYSPDGRACDHKGCTNHRTHPCEGCGRIAGCPIYVDGSLADLAFRLRDEAVKKDRALWQNAMDLVFLKMNKAHWKEEHEFARWPAVLFWFTHKAQPIHWIIAALIAKSAAESRVERAE